MPYLDNLRIFLRTVELGSISAAGRDQRVSAAVASARIQELEKRLGVRLFNRTTRKVVPTEMGRLFYAHAGRIIDTVEEAEAALAEHSTGLKGSIHVAAPLGLGRRIVAPVIPAFNKIYPEVEIRLRLSDHIVDLFDEGVDLAFQFGELSSSTLKRRVIRQVSRTICAAPSYLEARDTPQSPADLADHDCLLLRFAGTTEQVWALRDNGETKNYRLSGPFSADDSDVLIQWALAGHGIINRARYEVAPYLASGDLVEILPDALPDPSPLAILYPHRKLIDPKVRIYIEFMLSAARRELDAIEDATAREDA
ncbi:LysR substrate-binding domain-containing protein [Paracoccaceae bacterium GXU_MW_L88]